MFRLIELSAKSKVKTTRRRWQPNSWRHLVLVLVLGLVTLHLGLFAITWPVWVGERALAWLKASSRQEPTPVPCPNGTLYSQGHASCVCTDTRAFQCQDSITGVKLIIPETVAIANTTRYMTPLTQSSVGQVVNMRWQLLSRGGYPIIPAESTYLPAFKINVEHAEGKERFTTLDMHYSDGTWDANVQFWTEGLFEIQLWREGEIGWETVHGVRIPESDRYDYSGYFIQGDNYRIPRVATLKHMVVNEAPKGERLTQHLQSLPPCRSEHFAAMPGRWLHRSVIPSDFRYLLPVAEGVQDYAYLGASCLLRLYDQSEARTCLRGKNLTFLGDSTVQEIAVELIKFIGAHPESINKEFNLSTLLPPAMDKCRYRERFFTHQVADSARVTFCWAVSENPCRDARHMNVLESTVLQERIRACVTHPSQVALFPANLTGPQYDQSSPSLDADSLYWNAGLHELLAYDWVGRQGLPLETRYRDDYHNLDTYASHVAALSDYYKALPAKRYFFQSTLPKISQPSWAVRWLNKVARPIVTRAQFEWLPNHDIALSRSNSEGRPHWGSLHHLTNNGQMRSPPLFLALQLFLNRMCGE